MEILFTKHWNLYFEFFSEEQYDIYFKEEYVYLYKSTTEEPCCLVIHEGNFYMLFPFLKRTFYYQHQCYFDFETAYGYGGPVYNTCDESFIKNSLSTLYETFNKHFYIAGFVRFHPLMENYYGFEAIGKIIFDRKTIAIDLSQSESVILMDEIHTKNRNVIKKAEKNGLEFIVDENFLYLPSFIKLYNSTMDKLSADGFYYFSTSYYQNLRKHIANSFLGIVKKNNDVLSAAIFFYHPPYSHYHLSGSNKEFLYLSPNNFMLYQAALELKRRGAQLFHLGGGTTSSESDSLYCFKSRFSKNRYQFAIGKLIFNSSVYQNLCHDWEVSNPEKVEQYKYFLLKYKY